VKQGAVKVYTVSMDGKLHTYGILGSGNLLGCIPPLINENFDTEASAFNDTDIYVIPLKNFIDFFLKNSYFALAVVKIMAISCYLMAKQIRDLSFMNTRQHLEQILVLLAQQFGTQEKDGIVINLKISHEELAELISANRSTITLYLNELKENGFIKRNGQHYVLRSSYLINQN